MGVLLVTTVANAETDPEILTRRLYLSITQLKDSDWHAREEAAQELGASHDSRAVVPLIGALADPNTSVRGEAAIALGEIKDPRATEPLIAALGGDPYPRGAAIKALGEIRDPRAVEPLIATLKEAVKGNSSLVVDRAAIALSDIGTPAVELLIAALKDDDFRVQYVAAKVLGEIRDPRAAAPLMVVLSERSCGRCDSVARALGKIQDKDPRTVDSLIVGLRNTRYEVREQMAEALGSTNDPRVVEPLIAALIDPSPHVRYAATIALGSITDPRAVDPLIVALKDRDDSTRRGAAVALGDIKDVRSVEPLITALADFPFVREAAAVALGEIGDSRAVEPLIVILKNTRSDVRKSATVALGNIGAPAVEPLIAVLNDPDSQSQGYAAAALIKIRDPRAVSVLHAALRTVIAPLYGFFIEWGVSDFENLLIEALNEYGDKAMAQDFLNCGNPDLEQAAKAWASRHMYQIISGGGSNVRWGKRP